MTILSVPTPDLPVGQVRPYAVGWWAMICSIITEAALFAYLLFGYFYFAVQPHGTPWPAEMPSFRLSLPATVVLLISSGTVWLGERGALRASRGGLVGGLGATFLLGIAFLVLDLLEWKSKSFGMDSNAYGSLFFIIEGIHIGHLVVGLLILLPLTVWSAMGYFEPRRSAPVSIGAIYWHFVNAIWLVVFFSLYITPYLGLRHGF